MDDITRVGIQYVANDIKQELKGDAEFLFNSALAFIQKIENIIAEYQHIHTCLNSGTDNLSRLKQVMQISNNALRQVITAQYHFEQKVNAFLGRQIHIAWVNSRTGEVFFGTEAQAMQIYTLASTADGFKGKISRSENVLASKLSSLPSFVQETYEHILDQRIRSHQSLFRIIRSRLRDNTDQNNPWHADHENTVYWQHPPKGADNFNHRKWAWSRKTSGGNLAQGYINFIFNTMETLGSTQYDIGHFMMDFTDPLDRIPGIVKGDIIIQDTNGQIHLAVKSSQKFSTASIGPYIAAAYKIIDFYYKYDKLTIDDVEQMLNSMENYTQSILDTSQEEAEQTLENLFVSFGGVIS